MPTDGEIPARAWDLDGLRQRYECFIAFAGQLRDAAVAGRVPPTDALIARTRVMDEWRAFPALDPDLPAELLPGGVAAGWARELFIGCYDLLGPLAALRVRQIITRYGPELADRRRLPQLGAEAERRARLRRQLAATRRAQVRDGL